MSTAVETDVFVYKGRVWAKYRATLGELNSVEAHISEFDQLFNDPETSDLQPEELFGIVKVCVGDMDSAVLSFLENWIIENGESAMSATANKQDVYNFFTAALVEFASLRRRWKEGAVA